MVHIMKERRTEHAHPSEYNRCGPKFPQCMYVCMYVCVCSCVHECVCMHACMYVCNGHCMYVAMHVSLHVSMQVCTYHWGLCFKTDCRLTATARKQCFVVPTMVPRLFLILLLSVSPCTVAVQLKSGKDIGSNCKSQCTHETWIEEI